VNPLPTVASIMGVTHQCQGSKLLFLTDATTGGVWVSSDITIATVGSMGVVTGVVVGIVSINYIYTSAFGLYSCVVHA